MKLNLIRALSILIISNQVNAISYKDSSLACKAVTFSVSSVVAVMQESLLNKKAIAKVIASGVFSGLCTKIVLDRFTPKSQLKKVKNDLEAINWLILLDLISNESLDSSVFFDKIGRYYLKSPNPLTSVFYNLYDLTNHVVPLGQILQEIQITPDAEVEVVSEAREIQKKIDQIDLKIVYQAMSLIRSNQFFRTR